MKYFFMFCITALLLGCAKKNGSETNEVLCVVDVPLDRNDNPELFDSFFELTHSIKLETTKESLIRKLGKIVFNNNNIYILDKAEKQVLVFDTHGKFLKKINHLGQGPNEYISLTDFSIKGDTLYLLDRSGSKLLIYKDDMALSVQTVQKAKAIEVFKNGDYALNMELGNAVLGKKEFYSYAFYRNGKKEFDAVPFNKRLCGYSFSQSEGANEFYHYSDSTFTLFPYNDTIYCVNRSNGQLYPYCRIKIGNDIIKVDDDAKRIKEIKEMGIPPSVFSFYNFHNMMMFAYYYKEDNPRYVICDKCGNILFAGFLTSDINNLSLRIISYESDKENNEILNLAYPSELLEIAKKYSNESEQLIHLVDGMLEDDNPVLFFYKLKNHK